MVKGPRGEPWTTVGVCGCVGVSGALPHPTLYHPDNRNPARIMSYVRSARETCARARCAGVTFMHSAPSSCAARAAAATLAWLLPASLLLATCLGALLLPSRDDTVDPRRLQGVNVFMSSSVRQALAADLMRAWDEQDRVTANKTWREQGELKSWGVPQRAANATKVPSLNRLFIERFIDEFAVQIHNKQRTRKQTCLDWSRRYLARFAHCIDNYGYTYEPHALHAPGKKTRFSVGRVTGDLGEFNASAVFGVAFDLAVVTQVLEHVPHFWRAIGGLKRLVKPGGLVLFSVPFAFVYHPFPGDFYRYSPMGLLHLFESNGFEVCHFVSFGFRSVQATALGLSLADLPAKYFTETRSDFSLLKWSSDYALIAQRHGGGGAGKAGAAARGTCKLPPATFTNEIPVQRLHEHAAIGNRGYWPEPKWPE